MQLSNQETRNNPTLTPADKEKLCLMTDEIEAANYQYQISKAV
jgi:hypothetical protein